MSGTLSLETSSPRPNASSPVSHSGWFGNGFFRPKRRFVGIDFGVSYVHIATLEHATCDGKSVRISRYRHRHDLPVDPFSAVSPESIRATIDSMCDALPRCVDGEKNIAMLSVPTPWIHYETTSSASQKANEAKVQEELQSRCDQMFGASAFRSPAHVSAWPIAKGSPLTMVAATAKDTVVEIAHRAASVGYQVKGVMPHGFALALGAHNLTTLEPGCMILLNRVSGLVSVTKNGHCGLTRTLPNCPREHAFGNDVESLASWIDQVASETMATLRYSQRHQIAVNDDDLVMLCGELAHIPGIDLAIADRLRRPVATWTYVEKNIPATDPADGNLSGCGPEMAIAYSLAHTAARSASQANLREASS